MPKRKADPGPSRDFCEVNAVAIPKLRFVDEAPDKPTGFYSPKTKKHREYAVTEKSVMGRNAARRETELKRDFNESLECQRARLAKRQDKATALLAKREKSSTIGGTRFDRDLESEGFILFRIYITSMITLVQAQNKRKASERRHQKEKEQQNFKKKSAGQYTSLICVNLPGFVFPQKALNRGFAEPRSKSALSKI